MKNRKKAIAFFLAGFVALTFAAGSDVLAEERPTVKAEGVLTSVEEDGSVIIDKKGYLVDASAQITNYKGKSVSLRSLRLPVKVNFEYQHAKEGFVIMFIKKAQR